MKSVLTSIGLSPINVTFGFEAFAYSAASISLPSWSYAVYNIRYLSFAKSTGRVSSTLSLSISLINPSNLIELSALSIPTGRVACTFFALFISTPII